MPSVNCICSSVVRSPLYLQPSAGQLCRLFDLSQEFNATLERSFGLSLLGAGVGIGGIYLLGWQVVQVLLVREIVTLSLNL